MSAWKEYKAKLGDTRPWHVISGEKVDDAEESMRYSMCNDCPEFIKSTSQCKQCGCFMKLKVKLKHAVCPLGKWGGR
jgi:hypothetical protein